jgi:ATP-binding cassette subfamily B protein
VELVDEGKNIAIWPFFLLAVGIILFRTLSRLLFFYPARIQQRLLSLELLEKLQSVSPRRYKTYSSGQIYQVMTGDIEEIRALVGFALLQVGNMFIALVVLVPKLASVSPKLLIGMIPMLIGFIGFTLIVSQNKNIYRKIKDLQGDLQNFIIETYNGKKTIKNYHVESVFLKIFNDYSIKELGFFIKASYRTAFSIPLIPLGVGLSFIWGAVIIRTGDLGVSNLILFSGFIFLFLEPLMFLSWIGVIFTSSYSSWKRIRELVGSLESPTDDEIRLQEQAQSSESIEVELWGRQINFPIKESTWSVLVGETGVGKTHILLQVGDVLTNQRRPFSYVAQTPYLFNDTVEGNIFLGLTRSEDCKEQAYDLLKLFGLDELAESRESLFNLEVGENGKRLSGGQAKRLCLVRSLMSGADILIWDDPFSSVDVILEKEIVGKLQSAPLWKDKTIVLSSHRLTTVRLSHEVVYIEKAHGIVQSGAVAPSLAEGSKLYEYFSEQMV